MVTYYNHRTAEYPAIVYTHTLYTRPGFHLATFLRGYHGPFQMNQMFQTTWLFKTTGPAEAGNRSSETALPRGADQYRKIDRPILHSFTPTTVSADQCSLRQTSVKKSIKR